MIPLYDVATKDDFDRFRDTCDFEDGPGWMLCLDDKEKDIKIWEQRFPNSTISGVKMKARLKNIAADVLYEVLNDSVYREIWDETMAEGYTVVVLDDNNDIGYYAGKSPFFGISGRDFCNQRSWWASPDQSEYIIMNQSVKHPQVPEKDEFVRAWSYKTGYIVRIDESDTNSCLFTYYTHTDLKGWIPDKLINKALKTFAPRLVDKMIKVVPAYIEWKKQQEKLNSNISSSQDE